MSWNVFFKKLSDIELYTLLEGLDKDIAEKVRQKGCPCGGTLHESDYERKPRGLPGGVEWNRRISFCCNRKGCRKRRTPPSVRFLGRKVYAGVWVVLVAAMNHGPTGRRMARLREELDLDRRTLDHWRDWWHRCVPRTDFWKAARGRFLPPLDAEDLGKSMVDRFKATSRKGISNLMKFLLPLTIDWVEFGMDF